MTVARPPYDPELHRILETRFAGGPPPLGPGTLHRTRAIGAAMFTPIGTVVEGTGLEHTEHAVPGPSGAPDVTLSVVRRPATAAPVPCVYFIHGGGMVAGNRHMGAHLFVRLVERFDVTVVSVEYRLPPEHPHPAPVDDCYAGLEWVAANHAALGIDPARILVMGGSAGGGLAAAVALAARDRGGPALIGQVLMAPMLDDRDATLSTRQYEDGALWTRGSNRFAWSALLGPDRNGDVPEYAAPARATDVAGLPPAYIDAGSAEIFRDEAVAYASRIWAAGGQAELHIWSGGFHGFMMAAPSVVSRGAQDALDNWLTRLLAA